MQESINVFSSDITRGQKPLLNNLYDLLNVVSATPIAVNNENEYSCDFQPKIDKHYTPNKKNRIKVKTVRDIRNQYEKDIYCYLPSDLEKQQSILMKKITGGSAKDENTKILAKNMLLSGNPLSKSAWQMLMNINPEKHANCIQFVIWNGKRIRVNGSKGGKNKFLCNYDLTSKKIPLQKSYVQKKALNKKRGLLQNSLTVKFKPGPLTRKTYLDDSYQKYNVGGTELTNLPKPALDIQPTYGVILEPSITNLLQNVFDKDGYISEKLAQFSVSVLGSLKNRDPVQNTTGSSVTFDLDYEANQRRILMRRDIDNTSKKDDEILNITNILRPEIDDKFDLTSEVKSVINNILDSVEISLQQDQMYSGIDEPREVSADSTHMTNNLAKDKGKRKLNELDRLDVTIIRLPEVAEEENTEICQKSYCSLGCICASLQCGYKLIQHCGRTECMFGCKCDFSKYKITNSFENECPNLIPGLLRLDNEINLRLAKEEQKFHQTVVVTGEKSILLKSEKRNWKASKRYADFYSDMSLKSELKMEKILSIVDVKLNCENIEPWCMVHKLYKCFCTGKFTDNSIPDVFVQPEVNETILHQDVIEASARESYETSKNILRPRLRTERSRTNSKLHSVSVSNDESDLDSYGSTCARIKPYKGRKYYISYYLSTNRKIFEMEKNDDKLHKRMMYLINNTEKSITETLQDHEYPSDSNHSNANSCKSFSDNDNVQSHCSPNLPPSSIDETVGASDFTQSSFASDDNSHDEFTYNKISKPTSERVPGRSRLVSMLYTSYRQYKQRVDQGKNSLDPPKFKKMTLYPWDFILNRYRERKNHFLISKAEPHRIFMAVDIRNTFFDNCMNIDEIRFADLHNYPPSIKNLLTNARDLKDTLCILYGLEHCWQFIGSIKVNQGIDSHLISNKNIENDSSSPETVQKQNEKLFSDLSNIPEVMEIDLQKTPSSSETEIDLDSSKWFVMTVENDFNEIQFYKRGFFVKYESIIKAINVARMSAKTVRLSSQKCVDSNNGPQFGIYAIPNANEYCVFIGPYDKDEPLGIETVKSISDVRKLSRTRGVWITTRKIDNLKVIDNPLSFMPQNDLHPSKVVPLEGRSYGPSENLKEKSDIFTITDVKDTSGTTKSKSTVDSDGTGKCVTPKIGEAKVVKPIKIRKTNGFYHLAPKNFLKQIPLQPSKITNNSQESQIVAPINKSFLLNPLMKTSNTTRKPLLNLSSTVIGPPSLLKMPNASAATYDNISFQQSTIIVENKKPVAEIAPQIKILGIYSESGAALEYNNVETKKSDGCMFILKPEEINKRLMEDKGICNEDTSSSITNNVFNITSDPINEDIENFLATSKICTLPNADIFVVSDEEDGYKKGDNYKEVLIECNNIENLGWIRGRINAKNELSFEFPGFKYTEFYEEEEAFSKINQVLSRKIYVPKTLNLEWRIIESENELRTKHMLKSEELGVDFVLTKSGPRHKRDLMSDKSLLRSNKRKELPDAGALWSLLSTSPVVKRQKGKVSDLLEELEEQSLSLENESQMLLNEFKKRGEALKSFCNVADDQHVAETLQNIMSPFSLERTDS